VSSGRTAIETGVAVNLPFIAAEISVDLGRKSKGSMNLQVKPLSGTRKPNVAIPAFIMDIEAKRGNGSRDEEAFDED
jgi:hypothetical protein